MRPDDELGSLTREVVVPPGDGPFDLGTLKVPMKGTGSGTSKSPPVNFTATKLDGTPVNLAQSKGKYVVLAFWAMWSDRSTEELKGLAKLQDEWKNDPRLALLGVSLDDDAGAVAKAVKARGYQWPQATMTTTNLANTAAAFDVSSLPAIYLIDPEGRVLARDLTGDRLAAAVRRALNKK
jgi:peroxiredoxin